MLLAAIEPQVRERLRGTALGKLAAYALLAVLICGYAAVVAFGLTDGQFAFEVAALAVGAGALGAPMVWQWATGRAPALMDSRVLTALGRWSYSIYLVHVGALLIVIRHVPSELGPSGAFAFVFVATSAISVAFATLMWWLVEEPLMLKRAPRAWWRSMRAVAARPQPPTEEQDTAEVVLGRTPAAAGAPTDA
jgi:peptidoglycan/LPS O-acetylase OafA/YrhL